MNPNAPNAPRRPVSQHILDKIANAQPTATRRPNIRDGEYLFEIRNLLSEDKRKGHCFIIELGVIEAQHTPDPDRSTVAPNPPGTLVGNVVNFAGGGAEAAAGNVKRFILGSLGFDEEKMLVADGSRYMTVEERKEAIMATYADLVSEGQPARGMLVRGSTYCTKIQSGPNKGGNFIGLNWEHVPNQSDAQIAARRALIDAGKIGVPLG